MKTLLFRFLAGSALLCLFPLTLTASPIGDFIDWQTPIFHGVQVPTPDMFKVNGMGCITKGFFSPDFMDQGERLTARLRGWFESGKLSMPYDVTGGLENLLSAYEKLFTGGNIGKVIVELDHSLRSAMCSDTPHLINSIFKVLPFAGPDQGIGVTDYPFHQCRREMIFRGKSQFHRFIFGDTRSDMVMDHPLDLLINS